MPRYRISQIALPLDAPESELRRRIVGLLRIEERQLLSYRIERKSVDARDKAAIKIVYGVSADTQVAPKSRGASRTVWRPVESAAGYLFPVGEPRLDQRPLIVGAGPAGLFCALLLAEAGLRPLVVERGDDVDTRGRAVAAFFAGGILDPECNIQFGEGGAGTYSDGKLTTQVNDPRGRNRKVLDELIEAGAPEEIAYSAKPHIGTDYLVRVVKNLRSKIEALGGELRFRCRMDSLIVEEGRVRGVELSGPHGGRVDASRVVLALGHSARDSFRALAAIGVPMEQKAFAIGLRVEHPQELISRIQYGAAWRHPALPAAEYKLAYRSGEGRGVYSFCMCPGGRVVNASSEPGGVACNGMSDFLRDGRNANSAIVVTVGPDDFSAPGGGAEDAAEHAGVRDPLAGVAFQRRWEARAFACGGGRHALPVQLLGDFLARRPSAALGGIEPDILGPYTLGDLNACLPPFVATAIAEGLRDFDRKLPGFARLDAPLTGVETRTSSPLRLLRDEGCQSSVRGLYPCGEGAGYAGGIMSAAMDGIRVAEAIAT